jgi:multiple sugar transport system substrate-binding protein
MSFTRAGLVCGFVCALLAVLPTPSEGQGKPVTITFWDAEPADLVKLRMEIIKAFESKYPNLKVDYLNVPYAEARQKLVTAAATKTLPDTMFFQATWLGEFATMGTLLDLQPYVDKWPGAKGLLPQVFSVGKAYKSTLYYLPSEFQIDAIYYRTDWFKEAGIKGPPTNWAEFLEAAKKLTDPAKNRYGFSMRGAGGSERYYIMWMLNANGNIFFEKDGSLGLHKHGGMDGLKWYVELCTVHQVCTPNSVNNSFLENTAEFSSGAAAMYIHNQYSVARQIKAFGGTAEAAREKFGTTPIPRGPKGRFIAANFTNGYVIFKQSAHPEETWELVKWMFAPENDSKWAQTTGALPANLSVYGEAWFRNNPFLGVFKQQLDDPAGSFNFPIQMAKWNSLIAGPLKEEFQKALLKQQTPEATGEAIAKAISDALK